MELSDLTSVLTLANHVGARDPITLAGRAIGLGEDEQRAGIPPWAWGVVLVSAGAAAGIVLWPRVRSFIANEAPWISQGGKQPSKSKQVFGRWRKR